MPQYKTPSTKHFKLVPRSTHRAVKERGKAKLEQHSHTNVKKPIICRAVAKVACTSPLSLCQYPKHCYEEFYCLTYLTARINNWDEEGEPGTLNAHLKDTLLLGSCQGRLQREVELLFFLLVLHRWTTMVCLPLALFSTIHNQKVAQKKLPKRSHVCTDCKSTSCSVWLAA
jgi:hypothetical protein